MSGDLLNAFISEATESCLACSLDSFWLAAVADGVPHKPCGLDDKRGGRYADGAVWLPTVLRPQTLDWAILNGGGKFEILVFALPGKLPNEYRQFLEFSGRVGAEFVLNQPRRPQAGRIGDLDATWVVALFDHFKSSRAQVFSESDQCRVIMKPWVAALLALKEWRDNESQQASEKKPTRHGPGFRSVVWCGQSFSFTGAQAKVVEQLWQAFHYGTPDVPDETLIDAAGSDTKRLRELFKTSRNKMHPAWSVMIVEGSTQGTHCLQSLPT